MAEYFLVKQGGYDDMLHSDDPTVSVRIGECASDEEATAKASAYLGTEAGSRKLSAYDKYQGVELLKKVPFEPPVQAPALKGTPKFR